MLASDQNIHDLSLTEIMNNWPLTILVLLEYQMLCVGCSVAQFHTIADACRAHGLDEEKIRTELIKATVPDQ